MAYYEYNLRPEKVDLSVWVLSDSIPQTGKTPRVTIKNLEATGYYYDFSSNTFKNAGWVTQYQTLTSCIDGLYNYSWSPTGLITSNTEYEAIFYYTGGSTTTAMVASDIFRFYDLNPMVSVAGGGGGNTVIKGVWTKKEKDKLFDVLSGIEANIEKIVSKVGVQTQESIRDVKDSLQNIRRMFDTEHLEQSLLKEDEDELRKFSRTI